MPARILIIDDVPTNVELMAYLLNTRGYVTSQAVDGEQGIEAAQRELPDLILCDLHLPKMDGYGVLTRLKADPGTRLIPVVAATMGGMESECEALLAAGFDGYLEKNFDPDIFVSQIEAFLRVDLRVQKRS